MNAANASFDEMAIPAVPTDVFQLVYVSESQITGSAETVSEALQKLVGQAAQRNLDLGVTGALLFNGRQFGQVIEGAEESVHAVMTSIQTDPRHTAVTVLERATVERRSFANWSMAQVELQGEFDWTLPDRLMSGIQIESRQRARSLVGMMQYWLLPR